MVVTVTRSECEENEHELDFKFSTIKESELAAERRNP